MTARSPARPECEKCSFRRALLLALGVPSAEAVIVRGIEVFVTAVVDDRVDGDMNDRGLAAGKGLAYSLADILTFFYVHALATQGLSHLVEADIFAPMYARLGGVGD